MSVSKLGLPKARSMTRPERQSFRDERLDPAYVNPKDGPNFLRLNSDGADWIADNIYKGQIPEDVSCGDMLELAEETYALTYNIKKRQVKEEKNS